ncbi:MAG: benzoate transport [Gammaproteobacteria bacterium]|jgi:benzoate transport
MNDASQPTSPTGISATEIIAREPMSRPQVIAVIICILLTALDGFDILSISFASPGIAAEWSINRAALGVVLSMELIGMAAGSIVLGNIADRFGRRPTILVCLLVMSSGMMLAGIANTVVSLSSYRFFTGLGIGGMLASCNALVAEHSNTRRRNLSVVLMASGFPLGAIVGGTLASMLLNYFDWRSVFIFGAIVTMSFIVLVWWFLPESLAYLDKKRPKGALEKINEILTQMGHSTISALGSEKAEVAKSSIAQLFTPGLARITVILTMAYFFHITTFYFILKWIPKIVVDMGYEASTAGGVLVWTNVGSLIGAVLLGFLSSRYTVRALTIIALFGAIVMVSIFGRGYESIAALSLVAATAGFFTNSAVVGLYALFAQSFPTGVRAGGTGFAIGVGRGGSAAGPIIAGYLFSIGQSLQTVALIMAMGSLVAAMLLMLFLRNVSN